MSKFSAYAAATTFASGDLIILDQVAGPTTKKMTAANLLTAALAVSTGDMILASHVFSVGPNGATGPSFQVDGSTASAAAGLKVTGAASGSGVAVAAIGGTNEPLTLDAKGSGSITIGASSTGNVVLGTTAKTLTVANSSGLVTIAATGLTITSGNLTLTSGNVVLTSGTYTQTGNAAITGTVAVTSNSATAFAVGRQGATSPGLVVDASTSTCVTGIKITPAAAAAGVAVAVVSSGTDEALTLNAKGAGSMTLGGISTGNVVIGTSGHTTTFNNSTGAVTILAGGLAVTAGGILSADPANGIGYSTGAGGVVSQGTSRTTTVVISKSSGTITLFSAAGSATPASFTVTNTTVAATDTIIVSQKSGTDAYALNVSNVAAGSFKITVTDLTGTTTEAPAINFCVVKGVAS